MDPQQLPFSTNTQLLAFVLLLALVVAPMVCAHAQTPDAVTGGRGLPASARTGRRGAEGAPPADGLSPVRICNWFGGRKAALSLRFDDSETSHIEIGLPALDKYGLIGTWLVSPGYRGYLPYASIWEGRVVREGHELGDHTMWHEGARTDEEAEREVGEPAVLLHKLQPQLKLITFAAGGGTQWLQRKPMGALLAKYDLVSVGGGEGIALSCSEAYPDFSARKFGEALERCLADGTWFQPHFHTICPAGPSDQVGLYITPEVFSECLEIVQAHRDELWQAGINVIAQYARERKASRLWVHAASADVLEVSLTCATDPSYYTQPLTMELDLPEGVDEVSVTDRAGTAVATRIERSGQRRVARWEVAPVDMSLTVRAKGIGADSRIEEMKAPGPHPYLFFTAAETPALLAKTSDPLAKSMWEALLRNADSYVAEATPAGMKEKVMWDFSHRLLVLGLAYRLANEESYGTAGVAYLMAAAADESWHAGKTEMLRTGQAVGSLGKGYDLLYDVLTEEQRAQIREVAVRHGLEPIMEESRKGDWWTDWYRANWGAVIYSNAGVAALAFLPDEPAMADWVRLAMQKMWHYTQALGAAGGWGESASYGSFAWSNGLVFLDSLRRAVGVDLLDSAALPQLPIWFINLLEPGGRSYVPFSNASPGASRSSSILAFVAREYRDGVVQSAAKQLLSPEDQPSVLDFLWYDPTVESKPLSTLPLTKVWPELAWATMRSSWDDPNAVLFGLKGGQKDWDHAHHDTNSFVLYAYGKPLLVDLLYPKEAWGCRTEAHNTIMVDGKEQRGLVDVMGTGGPPAPTYRGLIGSVTDAPWYTRMVGDATLAYEQGDVKSAIREVMYLRQSAPGEPDDYFVVFDDVNATRPVRMDWLLHTYGDLKVSGKTITITQDDAAVDVTMALPLRLGVETFEKKLADIGSPEPFPSADMLRYLKVHPEDPVEHGYFVSVLAPRAASAPSRARVTPLSGPNVVGAAVQMGVTRDVVLFALDEPEMTSDTPGGTVGMIGRSCFVRWSEGRLSALALQSGQMVTVNGAVIVDSPAAGDATLTFSDTAITGKLRLGGGEGLRIHVSRRPVKVLSGGREQAFEYDPDAECIKLTSLSGRDIQILLQ
ncbi:MAG: heparinase II/III family protein [Armatimonadota bacterium]